MANSMLRQVRLTWATRLAPESENYGSREELSRNWTADAC